MAKKIVKKAKLTLASLNKRLKAVEAFLKKNG